MPEGHLLAHAQQALVRLSSVVPFAQAVTHLEALLGIVLSPATARRQTLALGQRLVEVQTCEADPLGECPEEQAAAKEVLSVDGSFIPLVGGEWAEVKLLTIGVVESPSRAAEEPPTTSHISYFARLSDAATFSDQASGEIRRRGVERAQEVAAVTDGAEWIPGFVRSHRADALHILDFAHAAGYVHAIKEAIEASGGHLPAKWEEGVLHRLKHAGPQRVLAHLAFLSQHFAAAPMGEALQYLQKRREHMQYPRFRQQGWPIGSGMVESGNKVVIQARLKGAGMHWRRENVNPMLALRMALCNERWPESWHAQRHVRTQQRQQHRLTRQQHRQQQQQAALAQLLLALLAASPPLSAPAEPAPVPQQSGRTATQYRWGRQTFSPRMLQQGGYAKK